MHILLLNLVLFGIVGAPGAKVRALIGTEEARCTQPATVVLVAAGSSDWQGEAANKIVRELKARLGSCYALQEARFDAEPALQPGFTVKGARRDLVMVGPRTPMREAMETGFVWLITGPSPRTMVIIAHEQFYPTTVSTDRLLELARRSETRVHAIYLSSGRGEGGVFRRLGRSLRNGFVWIAETLALEERGYSSRDTSRLLKLMTDATGGQDYVATDERSGFAWANVIAGEILGHTR